MKRLSVSAERVLRLLAQGRSPTEHLTTQAQHEGHSLVMFALIRRGLIESFWIRHHTGGSSLPRRRRVRCGPGASPAPGAGVDGL